jgi:PDZ domain-containing secreted protein
MLKKGDKNKFGLGTLLVVLVAVFGVSYYYTSVRIPVKAELSQLQKIASDYKTKNGNFGIITLKNVSDLKNCFAGSTFIKTPEATEVLTGKDVENISCVFSVASGTPTIDG